MRGRASGTACRNSFVLRQGDDPGVETRKAVMAAVPLFFCSFEKIGATRSQGVGVCGRVRTLNRDLA